MPAKTVSASELKHLVVADLALREVIDEIDAEAVTILSRDSGWWAVIQRHDGRLDEAAHAAVADASRRLSRGFALDSSAG
jgi:hypothetical protein